MQAFPGTEDTRTVEDIDRHIKRANMSQNDERAELRKLAVKCGGNPIDEKVVMLPEDLQKFAAALSQRAEVPADFPPRILDTLRDMAERSPKGSRGPWEYGDGSPMQDDAQAAIAWITGQRAEVPQPPALAALSGKYGDVLAPFLLMMERELHANAGKGDRPGWTSMSKETAALEIYHHAAKLAKAMRDTNVAAIVEHAADVANMAMMALDVCVRIEHAATITKLAAAPQPQQSDPLEKLTQEQERLGLYDDQFPKAEQQSKPCLECDWPTNCESFMKCLKYDAPAQQPRQMVALTDEQIEQLQKTRTFAGMHPEYLRDCVREVERAHGIAPGGKE